MTSRAPGKLVLSGAYAVLRGAPAIVTAAGRYCVADGTRAATFQTPEVEAALALLRDEGSAPNGALTHPWFDAAELRSETEKLGLGSSAAILLASLFEIAKKLPSLHGQSDASVRAWLYPLALKAHRNAQSGGSGVDVAAATFGGTQLAQLTGDVLSLAPVRLPPDLVIEVWKMPGAAKTSEFVRRVFEWEARAPKDFEAVFGPQLEASERAKTAWLDADTLGVLSALRDQHEALLALGNFAQVPIVLDSVRALHMTLTPNECFLPSGAGGGDVTLYFGRTPSSGEYRSQAKHLGLELCPLALNVPGVSDI